MRPRRTHVSPQSLVLVGIPKKYTRMTLEDYKSFGEEDLEKVKDFVGEYINNLHEKIEYNEGIFFYGSNGVGKSMLASIILKECYALRYNCRRITFSAYVSEYTKSWNSRDKAERDNIEADFYEKFKGAEVLVLEEVGKEIDSKIAKPILEDLLRYREEHGLLTIMCSNLKPSVIFEAYGPSVESLIRGNMTPVKITGTDRRAF